MKKALLIIFATFLLFASCKQSMESANNKEEYGSILINMEGGARLRDVGENGLPDIKTSKMKLKLEASGMRPIEKTFEATDEKKYEGKFKVGTTLDISIIIIGKNGEWSGKTTLVVGKGDNKVFVKLDKVAKVLGALKFSLAKDVTGATNFELGFEGSNPFFNTKMSGQYQDVIPSFCRDQKGQVYIAYQDITGVNVKNKIVRYTSEGTVDASFTPYDDFQGNVISMSIASDMKSGNVFVALYVQTSGGITTKIALVKDEEIYFLTPTIDSFVNAYSLASYDNVLAIAGVDSASQKPIVRFYQYRENAIEELSGLSIDLQNDLSCKVKKEGGADITINFPINDMFMDGKNLYCVSRIASNSRHLNISTGRVLQYEYNIETKTASPSKMLAGLPEYEVKDSVVNVKDESKEAYGPLKFVGFDKERLFIADDGVVQVCDAGEAKVKENKNRLVYISLKDGSFGVAKADLATWLTEKAEIGQPAECIVFFDKSFEGAGQHGKTLITLKSTSKDGDVKIDGNKILEVPDAEIDYIFDGEGDFYVVGAGIFNRYIHKVDGPSISYTKDTSFYAPSEMIEYSPRRIFYDRKTKDLYCLEYKGMRLFRRDGSTWQNIDVPSGVGGILSHDFRAIYGDILYSYDESNFKVYTIKIDDTELKLNDLQIDLASVLNTGVATHGSSTNLYDMIAFKDVLYITYSKASENSNELPLLYVLTYNLSDKALKSQEIKLEGVSLCNFLSTYYIGSQKEDGKVFFGLDCERQNYDGRLLENLNKYMSLKYNGSTVNVKIEDAPGTIWAKEGAIWEGNKQTLLWNCTTSKMIDSRFYGVGQDHVNTFNDANIDLNEIQESVDRIYTPTNKFCYDQKGNLYVLYIGTYGASLGEKYLVRIKLKGDGTYDFASVENNKASFSTTFPEIVDAQFNTDSFVIVADAYDSGTTHIYTAIYDADTKVTKIERYIVHEPGGYMKDMTKDLGWQLEVPEDAGTIQNFRIVRSLLAMAVNKDGLFVAIKELEVHNDYAEHERAYNIQVRKYSKKNSVLSYASPMSFVDVIGTPSERVKTEMYVYNGNGETTSATPNKCKAETIADMIAYNGKLYALSTLKTGRDYEAFITGQSDSVSVYADEIKISGTLWMLGATNADLNTTNIKKVKTQDDGSFAPCHVIGILQDGFCMASDGYYGKRSPANPPAFEATCENDDRVWTLVVPKKKDEEEALSSSKCKARFNFKLKKIEGPSSFFSWE